MTRNKFYLRGGRYRQVSLKYNSMKKGWNLCNFPILAFEITISRATSNKYSSNYTDNSSDGRLQWHFSASGYYSWFRLWVMTKKSWHFTWRRYYIFSHSFMVVVCYSPMLEIFDKTKMVYQQIIMLPIDPFSRHKKLCDDVYQAEENFIKMRNIHVEMIDDWAGITTPKTCSVGVRNWKVLISTMAQWILLKCWEII